MMNQENKQFTPEIIQLEGLDNQVLLCVSDVADILYWGKKITIDPASIVALERPIPYGCLDTDIPLTLTPELGRGLFSSPALEGHRQGYDWSPVFSIQSIERESNSLILTSRDPIAALEIRTELVLGDDDVLKIRHHLTNTSPESYLVNRFAVTLPVPERATEVMHYHGRWVHEFQTARQSLMHGGYQQENRRGRTSHQHYPALVVGTHDFNEEHGDVWGCHFAWSGNHRMRVDVKADGRRYIQAEVIYFPGEIQLHEKDSLTTPWLYASYSDQGLNKMSHQFHRHIRDQILLPSIKNKARPIHLNTWEGIYFEHDPEYIKQMATQAASLGIERFIIDDGWFKGRCNDKAGLGDWYLDELKYPDGLMPLIQHIQDLGMEFGLWFEPEMINKNSDLYRDHPDWLLAVEGYEQPTGRNQYALDLSNQNVSEYLLERLDYFLRLYPISYIKWDMNRELVQPGHKGKASGLKQVEAYYRLIDKLREKHPDVEIESCSAGGGRIDFEVLKRTHRFWPSDNNDALERQQIQRGMSYFFPPEVMGAHIGATNCHSTRRQHSISFRGLTALFGHMGIEFDPVKEDEATKKHIRKYIALHKKYRGLIHTGDIFRLNTDDKAHLIHGVMSKDKSHLLVLIVQLQMPTHALSGFIRIPKLTPHAKYAVNLIDAPENINDIVNSQPSWMSSKCYISGEWCDQIGLAMPILDPETAVLIELKQVRSS